PRATARPLPRPPSKRPLLPAGVVALKAVEATDVPSGHTRTWSSSSPAAGKPAKTRPGKEPTSNSSTPSRWSAHANVAAASQSASRRGAFLFGKKHPRRVRGGGRPAVRWGLTEDEIASQRNFI